MAPIRPCRRRSLKTAPAPTRSRSLQPSRPSRARPPRRACAARPLSSSAKSCDCARSSTGIHRKPRRNMATNEQVLAALDQVAGPDGKTSLRDSGILSGLNIHDGKVYLTLTVLPERAQALEPMRLAAQKAVAALPGVAAAFVALTAERAPQAAAPSHAPRAAAPAQGSGLAKVAKIIGVASGKG